MLEQLAAVLALKWRSAARRRDVERDLDDELADHLERRIDDFVSRGVARPEAERLARAGVVSTMALVSIIACWVPTRRAMRVNPLVALRDA